MSTVNKGANISYVSKEKREEIASLDERLTDFSSVSFVNVTLKTCTCQYSWNYGLPCWHQFDVAFSYGLGSITID